MKRRSKLIASCCAAPAPSSLTALRAPSPLVTAPNEPKEKCKNEENDENDGESVSKKCFYCVWGQIKADTR